MTAHTALGAYLRKHREECGDDLAVVAARLGLPKRVVEDFERGEKMPSKEEGMRALAACYRLSYGKVESLWNPSRADRRAAVEPKNLDLGANIRRMRQARGLSQAQLAMAASTSQGNISLLELGLRNPAPELTQRVLAILEADPANAYFGWKEFPLAPSSPKARVARSHYYEGAGRDPEHTCLSLCGMSFGAAGELRYPMGARCKRCLGEVARRDPELGWIDKGRRGR